MRMLALLTLVGGVIVSHASAQQVSVLRLGSDPIAKVPFQGGDCLDIRSDKTVPMTHLRVVVLDTSNWPWVRAKSDGGEIWINFNHVTFASRLVVTNK